MEAGALKYREEYKVYAGRYGVSERTVKRWVAMGREKGIAAPLDDVERMREWWAQVSPHRCPDKLLVAAISGRKEGVVDPVEAVPAVKKVLPEAPVLELPVQKPKAEAPAFVPRELREVGEEEMGTEASLARLKRAEVLAHELYEEALREGNEAKAKLALKSFTDLAAQVAKLEEIVEARRIRNRDLIPRQEAETLLGDFHQELLTMLRGLGELVFRTYGIPLTPENEEKWQLAVIDQGICEVLQREVFTE